MGYNNPNDYWHGYDPYKGMNEEERMKAGCLHVACFIAPTIVALLLCALLGGCTTTKYVTLPEVHTEHHWHTDSVREVDSVQTERETIVRELDSAAMAQYGIRLQQAERAWLVQTREMERRMRELEHQVSTRDTIHDSIPRPYPVEVVKEVPAPLTWWQQARLHLANIFLWVAGLVLALTLLKYFRK